MDNALWGQLLASYGAQPTPENLLAAKEFFASNPQVAEHRAMGMRGSVLDDNSDLFAAQLSKLMQQTAPPQSAAPQVGLPTQTATAPAAAPSRGRVQQQAPSSPQGPAMGPQLPMASGMVNPLDAPSTPQTAAPSGTSGWEWLLALLGATAAGGKPAMGPNAPRGVVEYQGPEAEFVGRMPRGADAALQGQQGRISGYTQMGQERVAGPQPALEGSQPRIASPQGRVEDKTPRGNYESVGNEMDDVRNREANRRSSNERTIRSEVDAENEQAQRLMEQMRNRQRAQGGTRELLKQAGRAVGRR